MLVLVQVNCLVSRSFNGVKTVHFQSLPTLCGAYIREKHPNWGWEEWALALLEAYDLWLLLLLHMAAEQKSGAEEW